MHVICPSCDAAYDVPAQLLGAGPRRLRCARCKQEWTIDATPAPTSQTQAAALLTSLRAAEPAITIPPPPTRTAPLRDVEAPPYGPDEAHDARFAAPPLPPPPPLADDPAAEPPSAAEAVSADRLPTLQEITRNVSFAPVARPAQSSPKAPISTASIALAWALSFGVLAMCASAAYIWRSDVIEIWPPSERAYAVIGLR